MNNTPLEEIEQTELFRWAAWQQHAVPELALLHAIPNGGKRSVTEAKRLKAQGVKTGVSDVFLPVARGGFHGLYIEMKRQQGGRLSEEQRWWLNAVREQGYAAYMCCGWNEAAEVITEYIKNEKIIAKT